MEKSVSKELVYEYFSGRATSLQKKLIEEWLWQAGNEALFYQYLDEWENTYPQHLPEVEKNLAAYEEFMAGRPGQSFQPVSPAKPAFFNKGFRWAAVVSLIMLLAGAGGLWGKEHLLYQTYRTGAGETKNLLLADHSRVTLNANTSLKVTRTWFSKDQREVWLTGEAFFNIHKTPDRQRFRVHTATLTVEVLGTKFNVTDRRRKTRVVLQEGKVKVTSAVLPAARPIFMQSGDYLEHSRRTGQIKKKTVRPENYTAWRENKLIFEGTPLWEVLQTVEDHYGTRIRLEDATLITKQYTGILPGNDLAAILKSLSAIYQLEVIREDHQITLY